MVLTQKINKSIEIRFQSFNCRRLLALFILAVATVANGNVIYDPYYGQIGLLPPQYRINPLYSYLSPQVSPRSPLLLPRSENDTVPSRDLNVSNKSLVNTLL